MKGQEFDLDTPQGFLDAVIANRRVFDKKTEPYPSFQAERLYCSDCGDYRRVWIRHHRTYGPVLRSNAPPPVLSRSGGVCGPEPPQLESPDVISNLGIPCVFTMTCLQCDASFTTLVYEGPDGRSVVTLPKRPGGVRSPHTPDGVAYYLNQAAHAHSGGAHSAAVTMFRSSAEWLLHDQGFTTGMLGAKLAALETAIKGGRAPEWASKISESLEVIRLLGNDSTHTNGGDLSVQAKFDAQFYVQLQAAFADILQVVYEEPVRHQTRVSRLREALRPKDPRS